MPHSVSIMTISVFGYEHVSTEPNAAMDGFVDLGQPNPINTLWSLVLQEVLPHMALNSASRPVLGPEPPSSQFYFPHQVTLEIQEYVVSASHDSFTIRTNKRSPICKCNRGLDSFRQEKQFSDRKGNLIYTVYNQLFSLNKSFYCQSTCTKYPPYLYITLFAMNSFLTIGFACLYRPSEHRPRKNQMEYLIPSRPLMAQV